MAGRLGDMAVGHESVGVMFVESKKRFMLSGVYAGPRFSYRFCFPGCFECCFGCRFACCFGRGRCSGTSDSVLVLVLFKLDHLFWFESTHVIWGICWYNLQVEDLAVASPATAGAPGI